MNLRSLPLLAAALFSFAAAPSRAQDTTPPTVELAYSQITDSPVKAGYQRFTFYVNAADETELAGAALQWRTNVDGKGYDVVNHPTAGWVNASFDPLHPIVLDLKCKSVQFEVRAKDAAGNFSDPVVKLLKAPFLKAVVPLKPKFAKAKNFTDGGQTVDSLEARFDFDGDGNLDILQADHDSGLLRVRLNNEGTGQVFTSVDTSFAAATLDSAAAGNLTGAGENDDVDTLPDIAVAHGGTITVLRNQGTTGGALSFVAQTISLSDPDYTLRYVAVADVDGDGKDDIIATAENFGDSTYKIAVFLNNGDTATGGFDTPVFYDVASLPYVLQVGDLNGDGFPDLIVGEAYSNVEVLVNTGTGGFFSAIIHPLAEDAFARSIAVGDLAGNGKNEFVVGTVSDEFINGKHSAYADAQVFQLSDDEQSLNLTNVIEINRDNIDDYALSLQASVALADMNADGRLDLIACSDIFHIMHVYTNFATTTTDGAFFALAETNDTTVTGGAFERRMVAADMDGNGLPDLVTANEYPSIQTSVLINVTPAGLKTGPASFKIPAAKDAVSGYSMAFSAVLAGTAPNLKVMLQYSATKDGPWTDVGYFTLSGTNQWKKLSTHIPAGTWFFRAYATATGFPSQTSKVSAALTVKPAVYSTDLRVAEVTSVDPYKATATSVNRTLKVVRGETGMFALVITNTGSANSFTVSAPNSIGSGTIRARYSTDPGSYFNDDDITDAVLNGNYTTDVLGHGGTETIYMKVRPSATAMDDQSLPFNIVATSVAATTLPAGTTTASVKPVAPNNSFFVTNTNDTGTGSLRDALAGALLKPAKGSRKAPVIKFEIYANSAGTLSIQPLSVLPPITSSGTIIDGNTEQEYLSFLGLTGISKVRIFSNGDTEAALGHPIPVDTGLDLLGSGCVIKNLIIAGFNVGLQIEGTTAHDNIVSGCTFFGNVRAGLLLKDGAKNNLIGGTVTGDRNYTSAAFSANPQGNAGIEITGAGTDGNKVQGNTFGFTPLANTRGHNHAGVLISAGAQGNLIGGTSPQKRNLIVNNGYTVNGGDLGPFGGMILTGSGTNANIVQNNYIGADSSGTQAAGNSVGLTIEDSASGNLIGGTDEGAGNLVVASTGSGIRVGAGSTGNCTGNRIAGNIIGLDWDGAGVIANNIGITLGDFAIGTIVGGTTVTARNLISGNTQYGILIQGKSSVIQSNYIGLNRTGQYPRGNGLDGICILGGDSNLIGGEASIMSRATNASQTRGNVIANNNGAGVSIFHATGNNGGLGGIGNTIRGNSSYANAGLAIDLVRSGSALDGTNNNDGLDADTGANDLQNRTVITDSKVMKVGSKYVTRVSGLFNSLPTSSSKNGVKNAFAIDIYVNDSSDPSGFGEGQTWLDTVDKYSDANGDVIFTVDLPGIYTGKYISATVTHEKVTGSTLTPDSTSEFSIASLVVQ